MNTSSLRPFGAWIKESWHRYQQNFSLYAKFGAIMLLANIPSMLADAKTGPSFLWTVVAIAITLPTTLAMIIAVTESAQHDSLGYYYGKVRGLLWSFLWTLILTSVITTIGFFLLIIPGVIWTVHYMFAELIVVTEGKSGMAALRQSKSYVKGNWWRIVGRCVLFMLLFLVGFAVLSALGPIIPEVVATLLYPFFVIAGYLMYLDLKASKPGTVPPQEQVAQPVL